MLDLTGNKKHKSFTLSAKTGYPVANRAKPETDANRGRGWSSFVAHADLKGPNSRFLVDDTLYVQVVVS